MVMGRTSKHSTTLREHRATRHSGGCADGCQIRRSEMRTIALPAERQRPRRAEDAAHQLQWQRGGNLSSEQPATIGRQNDVQSDDCPSLRSNLRFGDRAHRKTGSIAAGTHGTMTPNRQVFRWRIRQLGRGMARRILDEIVRIPSVMTVMGIHPRQIVAAGGERGLR